uniref:Large ribosomal subunit protein mL38 n=1 Tax=Amblyomma sculptum TaxID=1581419 RepID=A0A1E1XTU5_AMBSC
MATLAAFLRNFRALGRLEPAMARSVRLPPLSTVKSLEEKMQALKAKEPVFEERVNIGFKVTPHRVSRQEWKKQHKIIQENKDNYDLAEKSRNGTLKIQYEEARQEWRKTYAPMHVKEVADHYGVFRDLYEFGFFHPVVPMDVLYEYDAEYFTPVHYGNIILPSEAAKAPTVAFDSEPNMLWTLLLTSLDSHLLENDKEYLHWFVGNIKGNQVPSGEVVCDYLQPFLPRGAGYHRFVFVLYKQEGLIDYSNQKLSANSTSLKERTFKTYDFYKEFENVLTPAGLAFFQCTWEDSLVDFFHKTLKMRVPTFEYVHPPEYVPKQVLYPHRKPFNTYLDMYRDPRDIREEVYLKRLKSLNPLEDEPPMPKYPNIYKIPEGTPSWLVDEMRKERFRIGKYKDLRPFTIYPEEEYEDPKVKAWREQKEFERMWAEQKAAKSS